MEKFGHNYRIEINYLLSLRNLLCIISHTSIQFLDMFTNKPYNIWKIWCCSSISNKSQHTGIINSINIQSQSSNSYPHHWFWMVEKLYSFCVQRKIICMLKENDVTEAVITEKKNLLHYKRNVLYEHSVLSWEFLKTKCNKPLLLHQKNQICGQLLNSHGYLTINNLKITINLISQKCQRK